MDSLSIDTNQILSNNKTESLQNSIKNNKENQKLKDTCKEFEALFIKQMLSSMKKTVTKSGLIKENMGEKIFDDMLYDDYAKSMADSSDFGIADMMYKQLSAKKYQ